MDHWLPRVSRGFVGIPILLQTELFEVLAAEKEVVRHAYLKLGSKCSTSHESKKCEIYISGERPVDSLKIAIFP